MRRRIALPIALILALPVVVAHAQTPMAGARLAPNARIRVMLSPDRPAEHTIDGLPYTRVGLYIATTNDSIALRDTRANQTLTYALTDVRAVQMSLGYGRNPHNGRLLGLAGGALLGGVIGGSLGTCHPRCSTKNTAISAVGGAAFLGLVGLLFGTAADMGQRTERWIDAWR